MKEIDIKEIRSRMYSEYKDKKKLDEQLDESSIIRTTRDTVLIESKGQRQYVPTVTAFARLVEEHQTLKTNHNKAVTELNKIRESVKNLIQAVNAMDDELKRKIDLPDV